MAQTLLVEGADGGTMAADVEAGAMLQLRLFDRFDLRDASGASVVLATRKDKALLARLALAGAQGCERAQLAALLWPDRSAEQAYRSLRQSLFSLRRALQPSSDALPADRRSRLVLQHDWVHTDVAVFERLARDGDIANLEQAAALYRGPLLDDMAARSSAFDDWLRGERTRLDDMACDVFARLSAHWLAQGDAGRAEAAARRVIAIDPLREEGHRLLMRALHAGGRRSDALQQFHRVSELLRDELDIRPDPDTVALYRCLRNEPAAVAAPGAGSAAAERPGLIVLPIRYLDAQDANVADGLTEELTVALAAYRWFFVISSIQANAYAGRSVDPIDLRRELGVNYVLDGRLRRNANRFRLRLNLTETERSSLLWSQRTDCYGDELLQAQDELALEAACAIEPQLLNHEERLLLRQPPRDLAGWELVVRAMRLSVSGRQADLGAAFDLARSAVERVPDCAFAQASLAWCSWMNYMLSGPARVELDDARAAARNATEIDPAYYLGYMTLGGCQVRLRDHDDAIGNLRRALDLNPSCPGAYNQLISALTLAGSPHEALGHIEPHNRISQNDAFKSYYACVRSLTHYMVGEYEQAIDLARYSLSAHPVWLTSEVLMVSAHQRAGLHAEAREWMQRFRANHQPMSLDILRRKFVFRFESDFMRVGEPLLAAGLPAA